MALPFREIFCEMTVTAFAQLVSDGLATISRLLRSHASVTGASPVAVVARVTFSVMSYDVSLDGLYSDWTVSARSVSSAPASRQGATF